MLTSSSTGPEHTHLQGAPRGRFRRRDNIEATSVSAAVNSGTATGVDRFKTLYTLLAELSRAHGLEDVYHAALTSLLEATSADRAAILMFDDDGVMRFRASRGLSAEYQAAVTGHSPWLKGEQGAKAFVIDDALADESLLGYRETLLREGIRALAFVPLALSAGVFGKFMLYYAEPCQSAAGDLEIATAIAAHVALAAEQKRAEVARVLSEQRLQAILDYSPAVIFQKDLQGRYLLVNQRWEELFHISKGEVIGRTDLELFPKATAEQFRENDRLVLAAGAPLTLEESAPVDDGVHSYISVKFPLVQADGSISGIGGIATDITERRQLEIARQRLAAVVESSEDAIVSKDLNGIITSWNQGAERMFGYTAAEAIGQPVSMLAAPDRVDEIPEIIRKIKSGQRVGHYETRRRRKDGQIIDVALTVSPVRDAAGRIVGASKIARDISRLKRVEQERADMLAREKEARRTAELLNRVGPRLAVQLDPELLVQEVTDIATALVGAEFGSFLHNVPGAAGGSYEFSGLPKEAFARFPMPRNADLFAPTFRGESIIRSVDITSDPRFPKNPADQGAPEGSLPVRSYLAVPIVARSGEVLGGLFFGHSLPDRFNPTHEAIVKGIAAQAAIAMDNARLFEQSQWAQAELKRSNEELRRVNRDLEVFAYSASHDLQEPLRTIGISGQLIERNCRGQLQGDGPMFLTNIIAGARRMTCLIEDLLAYTRATKYEEGPPPVVDSGKVLAQVLETLRPAIEQASVKVTSGTLPPVPIHESRLAQLFQNLIGNAVKYRDKEDPRIHVTAGVRDGWCVFSVADNGIGIEPRFGEQIFGLFKRLHTREEYPGSGIGLSICQRVLAQYGGRIWLDQSEPGRGSTFSFALPSRP